tara:strand:+ start:21 stop:530 length:510 start_codon:yes stop_codon:yes gene_type:complete
MLFFSRLILIFTLIFLASGCGVLKSSRLSTHQNESKHIKSCGPEAIYDAIQSLSKKGIKIEKASKEEISKEIRKNNKCSTLTRGVLALFVYETRSITFPSEMANYFKERGFKVKKVNKFDELKRGDVALVLINKKRTLHYHWMSYPNDNNILRFFGKDTVLSTIYLLEK